MTAPRQVPTLADVIGPAIDEMISVRPTIQPFVDTGHYGDVITGWEGQIQLSRQRVAKEAAASQLGTASGEELTELARSEFDTIRLDASTSAIGEINLARSVIHYRADASTASFPPSAVDYPSLVALVNVLAGSLASHAASVYSTATGLGSHFEADTTETTIAPLSSSTSTPISSVVTALTSLQGEFSNHITGSGWHPTADTTTLGNLAALPTGLSGNWAAQSTSTQKLFYRFVNAIAAAVVTHFGMNSPSGVVRSTTTWTVAADSTAVPEILGGKYSTNADVSILTGQATATVPVTATKTGLSGNIPVASAVPGYQLTAPTALISDPNVNLNFGTTPIPTSDSPLFDPNLVPTAIYAAGGGTGQSDPTLRVASTAAFTGRYGPTPGALVAGSYASGQAAEVAIVEDSTTGSSYFYAADQGWATSHAWRTQIEQEIRDTWLGAGCRLLQGAFINCPLRIEATVVLRSGQYLSDTSDLTTILQAALLAYFDTRPDWYVWKTSAIQGVIAQADRRILSCSLLIVKNSAGLVLSSTSAINDPPAPVAGSYLTHWAFSDQGFLPTYTSPS